MKTKNRHVIARDSDAPIYIVAVQVILRMHVEFQNLEVIETTCLFLP